MTTQEQSAAREDKTFMSTALACVNTTQHKKLKWHSFLSKLGKRLYEIKLTPINGDSKYRQCSYLLHLPQVTHVIGKIFNQLSNKGLTRLELEIALLIYQGTQMSVFTLIEPVQFHRNGASEISP